MNQNVFSKVEIVYRGEVLATCAPDDKDAEIARLIDEGHLPMDRDIENDPVYLNFS
jgi:hypothetical protein